MLRIRDDEDESHEGMVYRYSEKRLPEPAGEIW